jgi:trimeric autotransporter adhesin
VWLLIAPVGPFCLGQSTSNAGFYISGRASSKGTALPGVMATVTRTADSRMFSTVSDDQGRYKLAVPTPGTYRVHVELFGFVAADRILSVTAQQTEADFTLALAPVGETAAQSQGQLTPQLVPSYEVPPKHSRKTAAAPMPVLSADIPMDFSFVRGQMAQPAGEADSTGQTGALSQWPVHFNASYEGRNSALDASPYALHGITASKPEYAQNTFGVGLGGTLPWGKKKATTSLFGNYNGSRNGIPYSGFATVPTAALRAGDFSRLTSATGEALTIYDPTTGQPFAGNRIPQDRMSSAALALLQYMALPSRDTLSQNFRFVTADQSRSDNFGLWLTRSSSVDTSKNAAVRSNLNASLAYHRSAADLPNVFPGLGGNGTSDGWNASTAYTITKGFFANNLSLGFNSTDSQVINHFAYDVAAALGINGVSRNSFDWGLPAIAFAQFTGLRDVTPTLRANRNFTFADTVNWSRGKHNLKSGGEFRRLRFDLQSSSDAEGSFAFTGFATSQLVNGTAVPGTGSDFADFLLGLPQKTHVQYSNAAFSFHGNAWNLYFLDDWRIAKNVSLNLGLRYEYLSPFSEAQNRLVTLDAPPDFAEVAVVRAGGVGPFSGRFSNTILAPDRNNFAPRIGVAWRAADRVIVRAGYSIDYETSLYTSLAPQLALQPPFAVGQTGIATNGQWLTLTNGLPALKPDAVANDFAAARNLPLSYAQIWVLQLQNELPGGFVLTTSYTGTKGSDLLTMRAPNRTATGLLLPNVAPFLWQADEGSSMLHAGSVALEKRFAAGLSFSAGYMFSRSIDDAPALGDETQVAQNDRALQRDRGLSAFDQRHRLAVNYAYELPFGAGRRWLNGSRIGNQLLGDWSVTGTINYASGFPFTPHVLGTSADIETGGYGALRPDLTGQPVQLAHPTVDRFFNTGAFIPPPAGRYGDAGRNIITGPWNFTFDAGLTKLFTIAERHRLEFHARATNLLNRPQFMQVDTNLNSLSYGQITGVGPMRTIQIGVRYSF